MTLAPSTALSKRVRTVIKPAAVEEAIETVRKSRANYEYFFQRLNSPSWIEPLREKGFFRDPPAPKRVGDKISFHFWPESKYLVRMSSHLEAQPLILDILQSLPETENVRVHEDIVDIALNLPAAMATHLVDRAIRWIASPYQLLLPEKLANLALHLAEGREPTAALRLVRELLEPELVPRPPMRSGEGGEFEFPPEVKPRFDPWRYEEILTNQAPGLTQVLGQRMIDAISDALERAIVLSLRDPRSEKPRDYSYIWRPAVEENDQNLKYSTKDHLVAGLRDGAERILDDDPEQLSSLVESLEKREWNVFVRIALHLVRRYHSVDPLLATARIANRGLFENYGVRHEYYLLSKECFGLLTSNEQAAVLSWIQAGPDTERYHEIQKRKTDKAPTEDEIDRYRRHWQLERYHPISNYLPGEIKTEYDALVAQFGPPGHADLPFRSTGVWVGPTSPKTVDELGQMSVADLADYLREWKPTGDPMSPSPEGLGRQLASIIAKDPTRFVSDSRQFVGLDPTYVRAWFGGLRDALKENRQFMWPPVLELARWVLDQPRELPDRKGEYWDLDPGWVWTRKEIASLLSLGVQASVLEIPFVHREEVWSLIRPLTDDPSPTPDDESPKKDETGMDPLTLSINSVRGEAMHSAIRYALWVHRHLQTADEGHDQGFPGFERMPEVREVLEAHLNPEQDPSLAIRAVYGEWFPWLVVLDSRWAASKKEEIFRVDLAGAELGRAAWNTYIIWCKPFDNVFDVLRDRYRYAIDHLPTERPRTTPGHPDDRLGEHILAFYLRGRLSLDPDDLVHLYFAKASESSRTHGIAFVGRVFRDAKDITEEVADRARALWDLRIEQAEHILRGGIKTKEPSGFGWWFASGKLNDAWAIDQLCRALRCSGLVEPDLTVVQRLAEVAEAQPMRSLRCLAAFVETDQEGWRVYAWRKSIRAVIEAALRSDEREAINLAVDFVHRLGAKGHFEFRDLLPRM